MRNNVFRLILAGLLVPITAAAIVIDPALKVYDADPATPLLLGTGLIITGIIIRRFRS
jgi:hypothetical protein